MLEQLVTLEARGIRVQFALHLDPTMEPDGFLLQHFQRGISYESELAWVMFRTLQQGDIALDVGANIGFFTMLMSRLVGDTGRIVACEPGPNNLPSLREHIKINSANNVTIVNRPIWCRDEPVTFYLNADNRSSNALFDPGLWYENEKSRKFPQPTTMNALMVDTVMADFDARKLKLIKIDTEGADQQVLEGAQQLLAMYHPPYVLVELNPEGMKQGGRTTEGFREFMRGFGYDLFFINTTDGLPALVPLNTRVKYMNDICVGNALFSTLDDVAKAWPETIPNG